MISEITRRIRVYGIVQGVGFLLTVSRHAAERKVRGNVCNKGPYVEIYAQGPKGSGGGFSLRYPESSTKKGGNPEDKCGKRKKSGELCTV